MALHNVRNFDTWPIDHGARVRRATVVGTALVAACGLLVVGGVGLSGSTVAPTDAVIPVHDESGEERACDDGGGAERDSSSTDGTGTCDGPDADNGGIVDGESDDGPAAHSPGSLEAERVSPDVADVVVESGTTVDFEVRASAGEHDLATVEWFVDDGLAVHETDPLTGTEATPTFTYTIGDGTHDVTAVIHDEGGAFAEVSWSISPEPRSDAGEFAVERLSPNDSNVRVGPGETVTFEVAAAASDGDLQRVQWDVDMIQRQTDRLDGADARSTFTYVAPSVGGDREEVAANVCSASTCESVSWTVEIEPVTDDEPGLSGDGGSDDDCPTEPVADE